ncbi:transposase [Sinorhizobium meliloti]
MEECIGLDVSMKETAIAIRRDGVRVWRGKCASDPQIIAELVRRRAPTAERVVFETGPLSAWFYHALRAEGLPVICIDARHAKAALDMATNKTDANDADGLARLAEVGFFREVRVKGFRAGSVCLNSFGRFAKWISATDYAAAIIGVSALK